MEQEEERPVRFKNLILYGLGDIYGGGSFLLIGMLFIFFLTDVVGLSPTLAALVFGIGKVWDAVSDPVMGYISDRTDSRFGRRRIYLLIAIVPIFLSFLLLWIPLGTGSPLLKVLYYSFAYVLFSTVFTMVMVPYAALNAEMTPSYAVRTRLSGARIIFSQLSALLAGTIPTMIINGRSTPGPGGLGALETGYLIMALVFATLYALPWIFVFAGTWELPYEKSKPERRGPPLEELKGIFKGFGTIFVNRSFRIHIAMYIFAYCAMDILMAMMIYYMTYNLGRPELYPIGMGSLLLTQILMLPVYVRISNSRGKGFAYRMGLSIWGVALLAGFFLGPETPLPYFLGLCILIGSGLSAGVMIPWAILPSITDVDEIITGQRRAGIYSGSMTLVRKMAQGLVALPLVGVVLQSIGYVANQPQSPETLLGMKLFFVFGPGLLILAGVVTALRFKITPESHSILSAELKRLREGGKKEGVTEETRGILETLTGISYSELYTARQVAE